jgi:ATP-dependent DNA helicase PIF1
MTKHQLLYHLANGETCALLGFPGTGKTTLTAYCIEDLLREGKEILITGSTAASPQPIRDILAHRGIHKNVQTIHSLLHFSPQMTELAEEEKFEKLERKMRSLLSEDWSSLMKTDILVVEEVSMLTGSFVRAMDLCIRILRRKPTEKFGGLALLLVGDFRQLPPVSASDAKLFLHKSWSKWVDKTFSLEFIMRQQPDCPLSNIIQAMSQNSLTTHMSDLLRTRVVSEGRQKILCPEFLPNALRVFDTNEYVFQYNSKVAEKARQSGIPCKQLFNTYQPGNLNHKQAKGKPNISFSLLLFHGAKVVVTANMDVEAGLVNGTTGTIVGFTEAKEDSFIRYGRSCFGFYVRIETETNKIFEIGCHHMPTKQGTQHYLPLHLFYATTVHKLQGLTVERPLFYMGTLQKKILTPLYIVCSRVVKMDLLHFASLPEDLSLTVDPKVVAWYDTLLK